MLRLDHCILDQEITVQQERSYGHDLGQWVSMLEFRGDVLEHNGLVFDVFAKPVHFHRKVAVAPADACIGSHGDAGLIVLK